MLNNNISSRGDQARLKVVILEDGKHARMGMEVELQAEQDIEVVGATAHPGEILEMVKQHQPDVAFIDLRIYGDMNAGTATIREIKTIQPGVKCIVLTAFPELPNFLAAFDAGAEGFIRKDALPEQQPPLGELVRMVVAGGRYYDPDLVGQMRNYLDMTRLTSSSNQAEATENPLTDREQEVLGCLARGENNSDIAAKLVITENTVKTHISNINNKLGAKNRNEAVLIAMSRGWLSSPPSDGD